MAADDGCDGYTKGVPIFRKSVSDTVTCAKDGERPSLRTIASHDIALTRKSVRTRSNQAATVESDAVDNSDRSHEATAVLLVSEKQSPPTATRSASLELQKRALEEAREKYRRFSNEFSAPQIARLSKDGKQAVARLSAERNSFVQEATRRVQTANQQAALKQTQESAKNTASANLLLAQIRKFQRANASTAQSLKLALAEAQKRREQAATEAMDASAASKSNVDVNAALTQDSSVQVKPLSAVVQVQADPHASPLALSKRVSKHASLQTMMEPSTASRHQILNSLSSSSL